MSKVSRVPGMGHVGVAILETAFAFGASLCRHVSRVSAVTGVKRVGSRSSELSSPLESRCVVACQNCQQSQSGSRSWFLSWLLGPHCVVTCQDPTVTGRRVGVAVLVTVVALGASLRRRASNISAITAVGRVLVAILVTLVAFRVSFHCCVSEVLTVSIVSRAVSSSHLVAFLISLCPFLMSACRVRRVRVLSSCRVSCPPTLHRVFVWCLVVSCLTSYLDVVLSFLHKS